MRRLLMVLQWQVKSLNCRLCVFSLYQGGCNLIKKWFKSLSGKSSQEPESTPSAGAPAGNRSQKAGGDDKSRRQTKRAPQPLKKSKEWDLGQFAVEPEEGKTRFHDLDLPLSLMRGIADLGFLYCSPIQAQALPHTLAGHDVIGKAQTGTGKTAAFLITIINDLLRNPIEEDRYQAEPRALIIAPTRELVMQIAKDAELLCKYTGLSVAALIGGMDYAKQQRDMNRKVIDIVVATPGRLLDFQSRGDIHLDQVELMVIDEADRMLDMGFIPQVRNIIRATPKKSHRQTLLFSATFTDEVMRLTEQWTEDPVKIEIEPDHVATDSVDQRLYMVSSQQKFTLLKNILSQSEVESAIIFANRRDQTRRLEEKLRRGGFKCGLLSGEIAQNKRTRTLEDFRSGKINVLVATDVAGRGIHIDNVSHVFNFTLPEDPEDYVHRIGRTGRAGKSGVSISFVCEDDAFNIPGIEAMLGEKLSCVSPPEDLL
jgi:ATP-dependent RNA helicase RhlB